ncbi:MAG TPA: allantoate amidohydrolase [Verrucomicrobiae bacterium]|nr:allantoate amidohydrolase [Verrucomicrobiae bacterium]
MEQCAQQVIALCRKLAGFTEEPGHITRTFLSPPMHQVHAELRSRMEALGMAVSIDAVGNLRGYYSAKSNTAPRLVIGSHLDTVPRAGAFDGVLGVVIGIALIEALQGRRLPLGLEIVGFSEEEGVRFAFPFIGSRALAGTLDTTALQRRDADGRSIADAIHAFGLDPAHLPAAKLAKETVSYLEFHIEQGPVLESLDYPLGIVEHIAGQSRATIHFTGKAGHAGTTPMDQRHDALAAAAQWIALVEGEAGRIPGLVATVGRLEIDPNASNVIAGSVRASLDVRHAQDQVRHQAVDRLFHIVKQLANDRGLGVEWTQQLDQPAVAMNPAMTKKLSNAVKAAGYPVHSMVSGAGHDAMILAERVPAAMLFLRSPGGISHHPDETVLAADVASALTAGLNFINSIGETL